MDLEDIALSEIKYLNFFLIFVFLRQERLHVFQAGVKLTVYQGWPWTSDLEIKWFWGKKLQLETGKQQKVKTVSGNPGAMLLHPGENIYTAEITGEL